MTSPSRIYALRFHPLRQLRKSARLSWCALPLSTNIRFINNTITGGSHGIIHVGNNTNRSPGTVFTGNTITNVYYRPAYFQYMAGGIFNNNTITHSGTSQEIIMV
ncbi:MAG: hypothetical protein IPK96_19760 [Flammeovirgaceae bacterium]|nr:hypothetical protein [Flammeovirgaceae bacterium]